MNLADILHVLAINQASLLYVSENDKYVAWKLVNHVLSGPPSRYRVLYFSRLSLPFKLFHALVLIIPHILLLLSFIIPIFPYRNSLWQEKPRKIGRAKSVIVIDRGGANSVAHFYCILS